MSFLTFQLHCCGVHSYEDFDIAIEFKKYTREEGNGQVVPEACCILEESSTQGLPELFVPKDSNCISTPTSTNSYLNTVCFGTFCQLWTLSGPIGLKQ